MDIGNQQRDFNLSRLQVSKQLAILALILWLVSLGFISLVFHKRMLFGYEILLNGWLGAWFFINLAWYANPLFLIAFIKLVTGRLARKSAIFAVVLAADTFRFNRLTLDAGGGSTELYGYGFGFLLWLSAILLILISAGIRQLESKGIPFKPIIIRKEPLISIGLVLLVTLVSLSFFFGIKDRLMSGETERRFLRDVVFKAGPVCTLPDIQPKTRIKLNAPLDVTASSRFAFSPLSLLSWGIPVVRKDGYDFFLRDKNDLATVVIKPATGLVGARIEYRSFGESGRDRFNYRLVSADGKTTAFDGEWFGGQNTHTGNCPGFFSFPKPDEPPRSLLMNSLISNEGDYFKTVTKKTTRTGRVKIERLDALSETIAGKITRREINNDGNCPQHVGLRDVRDRQPTSPLQHDVISILKSLRTPVFQSGNHLYFIKPSPDYWQQAVCNDNYVYMLRTKSGYPDGEIILMKHGIHDYKESWKKPKRIYLSRNIPDKLFEPMERKVISVRESEGVLYVTLAYFLKDEDVGEIVKLAALTGGSSRPSSTGIAD